MRRLITVIMASCLTLSMLGNMNIVTANTYIPESEGVCLEPGEQPESVGDTASTTVEPVYLDAQTNYSQAFMVLNLVNNERIKNGLTPLKMDQQLLDAAMLRAVETAILFSHERPDGTKCYTACSDLMFAENIAGGYGSPESVMYGWMNSSGHRSNILNSRFTTIGIGAVEINGVYYWTQCFGSNSIAGNCSIPQDRVKEYSVNSIQSYITENGLTPLPGQSYTTGFKGGFDVKAQSWAYYNLKSKSFKLVSSNPENIYITQDGNMHVLRSGSTKLDAYFRNSGDYAFSVTIKSEGQPVVRPDETKVKEFCERLYTKCLGRNADATGVSYWSNRLVHEEISGAELGYQFVFSQEYKAKNTSDDEFVSMLYEVFMNRKADASGKNYWLNVLKQGVSRVYVYARFAASDEYTALCQSTGIIRGNTRISEGRDLNIDLTRYVVRLYDKALGRSYEVEGLNYWCKAIYNKEKTPIQAAESFICSPEFEKKNLSNAEYVRVLYRTFMNREADAYGEAYWVGRLDKGETRRQILREFANCQEFKTIIASFGL